MLLIDKPGKPHEFCLISLTSFLALGMGKPVLSPLGLWIESILPPEKAGFRQFRSYEEQVARLTEDIAQTMYGKIWHRSLLGPQRAYDRVSVKGLLAKLGTLNCPPQLLLCLRAFLVNRMAYCR